MLSLVYDSIMLFMDQIELNDRTVNACMYGMK